MEHFIQLGTSHSHFLFYGAIVSGRPNRNRNRSPGDPFCLAYQPAGFLTNGPQLTLLFRRRNKG